jgi:formylglycine-generating enzyme required for sulfatase activity
MLLVAMAGMIVSCGNPSSDDDSGNNDDDSSSSSSGGGNGSGSSNNGDDNTPKVEGIYSPNGIEMIYVEGGGTVRSFYMGIYEVTQKQYQSIMNANPSNFIGDNHPVEQVSWDDAQEFIKRLNARTGKRYRLPTEAEWEYAAREGTKRSRYDYSGSGDIEEVAWYTANSGSETHPVGQKNPNAVGIYDMTGNVWEWCQDCYDSSCSLRVHRGGSWLRPAQYCRVAYRISSSPSNRHSNIGFRLVLP